MRFYFHLYNGSTTLDTEGVELKDDAAALRHGQKQALTMAAESVREGHIDLRHFIEVAGASGKRFFKVSFGEVVDIVGLEPSANLDYR